MAEKIPVWAIVRWDNMPSSHPKSSVHVVEVLPTAEEATSEVARLNGLVEGSDIVYFAVYTRFYPSGRGVESQQ